MTSGVVKSTPEAIENIRQMQNIISGGLTEQIQQLVSRGDALNPGNWDGQHAARFYESWGTVKSGLNNAITQLNELSSDIMGVNTNIQTAGGNQ
jgi:uncharacterized protein YukE